MIKRAEGRREGRKEVIVSHAWREKVGTLIKKQGGGFPVSVVTPFKKSASLIHGSD